MSITCFQAVQTSSAARRSRKVRKEKILSRTSGHSCSCRSAPAAGAESVADMRSEMSRVVRIVPVMCTVEIHHTVSRRAWVRAMQESPAPVTSCTSARQPAPAPAISRITARRDLWDSSARSRHSCTRAVNENSRSFTVESLLTKPTVGYDLLIIGAFKKEKALVGAFSGHCENFADLRCKLYPAPAPGPAR